MIVWLLIWIVWFLVANRESNAQKTEYKSVDGIGHETLEEAGGERTSRKEVRTQTKEKKFETMFLYIA